jgi:hypothetical protein
VRVFEIWLQDGQRGLVNTLHWPDFMHPNTVRSKPVDGWGKHRIEADGVEIAFAESHLGVEIFFYGRQVSQAFARRVVEEVLANIEQVTGQQGLIVESTPD